MVFWFFVRDQLHAGSSRGFSRNARRSSRSVASPSQGARRSASRPSDGLELAGTYYATDEPQRLGVVVFCHEFLGDRHSVHHYADPLRELGFDVFTFDFRNHGESQSEPGFEPIQWVSDRDKRDLHAALDYLRSRPDADPAGVALFGISRGGGVALCVAAERPAVWGVVTDGAFPTRGTMLAYILRWVEIYIRTPWIRRLMPMFVLSLRRLVRPESARSWRLRRRFPGHRTGRGPHQPPPLAGDPRRAGCLHRPPDRRRTLPSRSRAQGTLAGAGGQAQPMSGSGPRGVPTPGRRLLPPLRPASPGASRCSTTAWRRPRRKRSVEAECGRRRRAAARLAH